MDEAELVVLFSGSLVEADLLMGLLEQAGLASFLYNEQSPTVTGLGCFAPAQVAVARRDLVVARDLLQARSEDAGEAQP